ncbi:Hgh1p [Sporobolomyces salmoneus]|uniref:Hgh1p n=1 Tax=Sporobolomyces salmoneus TaxID=183962 RepID=UPI0031770C03
MAQQQTVMQLLELFQFLSDPQAPVRRIALANLLPYTVQNAPERMLFTREHHIEQIAAMCADQEIIAHDALSSLINLTSSLVVVQRLAKIPGFITGLVRMIVDEKALLSDLACMLLSNMSKLDTVSLQILNLRVPFSVAPSPSAGSSKGDEHVEKVARKSPAVEDEILALDLLLEVHLKGEGKKYNPNANYDFLASVFANISLFPQGRAFLLAAPDSSVEPPLSKLISFTEHPSPIRRGGVASTIKNAAFEKSGHTRLVAAKNDAPPEEGCIDLLVQILLPLCGNEEFDLDILDELPQELQLLPPEKEREPDATIRAILVETLVLLATSRVNREAMRARGVYQVIKVAHLAEKDPKVTEPMVRLVNLLMRDEGDDTAIEELAPTPAFPSFDPSTNTSKPLEGDEENIAPTSSTTFIGADGSVVEQEKERDWIRTDNLPLSQMQPEEDEEEMLLEV